MTWREQIAIGGMIVVTLFTPVYLYFDRIERRHRARRCDLWRSEWARAL